MLLSLLRPRGSREWVPQVPRRRRATWPTPQDTDTRLGHRREEGVRRPLGVSMRTARQGRVNHLGLISLSDPGRLWAVAVVSGCLVPARVIWGGGGAAGAWREVRSQCGLWLALLLAEPSVVSANQLIREGQSVLPRVCKAPKCQSINKKKIELN